jgi:hypothetical protein
LLRSKASCYQRELKSPIHLPESQNDHRMETKQSRRPFSGLMSLTYINQIIIGPHGWLQIRSLRQNISASQPHGDPENKTSALPPRPKNKDNEQSHRRSLLYRRGYPHPPNDLIINRSGYQKSATAGAYLNNTRSNNGSATVPTRRPSASMANTPTGLHHLSANTVNKIYPSAPPLPVKNKPRKTSHPTVNKSINYPSPQNHSSRIINRFYTNKLHYSIANSVSGLGLCTVHWSKIKRLVAWQRTSSISFTE